MKKVDDTEATIHREVWELEDPVESHGTNFNKWSRVWTEGEEDVEWIPLTALHDEPVEDLSVEVERKSDEFVLESRRKLVMYGTEVDGNLFVQENDPGEEEYGDRLSQKLKDAQETSNGCQYTIPWAGKCEQETVEGSDYCEKHDGKTCFACDKQATGGCSHAGSLVCGVPECDDHSHFNHH